MPEDWGSGGGSNYYGSSSGGGLVHVVAAELALGGSLLADGGGINNGSAGSGGGIYLEVGVLSGSGEITWSGATDLVNGNEVTSGEAGCTPDAGSTYVDGVEREGANGVPTLLESGEYTEHQWALDLSGTASGSSGHTILKPNESGAQISSWRVVKATPSVWPSHPMASSWLSW